MDDDSFFSVGVYELEKNITNFWTTICWFHHWNLALPIPL